MAIRTDEHTRPANGTGSAKAKAQRRWQRRDEPVRPLMHPVVAGRNPEAERAVLGAMMIAGEAWEAAADILTPDDFADERHMTMFSALLETPRAEHGPVDVVALDEELKRRGELGAVGGSAATHDLVNTCENAYRYSEYIRIVLECGMERRKQNIGAELTLNRITAPEAVAQLSALDERWQRWYGTGARPLGVRASDVEPEPIRWLWRRRLARGKLAIIDGDPGLGKGFITIDLAARISTGRAFPGDAGIAQDGASCILISPEDDIADTLVPRLIAAGANLERVYILNTVNETDPETGKTTERGVSFPRDVPVLEALIQQTGARLFFVDPIHGCLDGGVKTGIDSEVRAALMPLKHLATRTDACGVLVRHFTKANGAPALYRGQGSIAFTGLCRTAFVVAEHPDNPRVRVFLPNKNNLSLEAPGLSFKLDAIAEDAIPRVAWDAETVQFNATDVLNIGPKQSAEQREIIEVMRSGGVTLPCTPSDVALAIGVEEDDTAGQARIRKRLSRMQKAGSIVSASYGKYDLPSKSQSHLSHSSQVSQ